MGRCPVAGGTFVPYIPNECRIPKITCTILVLPMKVLLYLNTSIEKMNDISGSRMKPNPIDQQTKG
jgi:hypothetical protein